MSSRPFATPSEVIDALGGTAKTARKLGVSLQRVSNWRRLGIPPEMFLVVTDKLAEIGRIADPSVFSGMATPRERETSAPAAE